MLGLSHSHGSEGMGFVTDRDEKSPKMNFTVIKWQIRKYFIEMRPLFAIWVVWFGCFAAG